MPSIAELCAERTLLSVEEVKVIIDLSQHLQLFADVFQSDVFIDCPLADQGTALVVAEAKPTTAPSLYHSSVVGLHAYAHNEPAVMFCLLSGQPVIGSRGISQEQIAMRQNVVPIRAKTGRVIGVLIMEQDISEIVEQEKNVERLRETTEQLSETLLAVALSESSVQSLMHEGIVLFDGQAHVTYANPRARKMLQEIGHSGAPEGSSLVELFYGRLDHASLLAPAGIVRQELVIGHVALELKTVSINRQQQGALGLMLIRDISDLKEKEKQLVIKSVVIKEIHHRVKNNLQTVSSLLRLQMRRTKLDEVEKIYRDSINRINSIAVIHEMLAYDGLETIQFNDVLDRIAKNVVSSTAKPDQVIRIAISGDTLTLPSDIATTLALVSNELVQNCVTHAFVDREQGDIRISLYGSGQIVRMEVADNGIGLPAAGDSADRKGHLGLKITETLVRENLGGLLQMASTGEGTQVTITFPLFPAEPKPV
ncbi:Two-component sensor histidine kinase, contains HisKA and HATPase domains [Paenibacillus tianmuensis]|uniref:histidine kinase n=1 Tax=Paenibacillus tianmuensis TaxID=624147 RepID=A0A1G4PUU0_9BACL|nr:sensor histidine kinase [Paenibacillus tianmuensis]SCW36083.1 Two-component sensor histidine kinase, contains HisKA and HATPase domains [Paenibacillus tianmuensis]